MLNFRYTARDKDGKLVRGALEMSTREEAIAFLQSRGIILIWIKQDTRKIRTSLGARRLKFRLTAEDLTLFCHQLATLLNAGVTLLRSLSIILKQIDSRSLYDAVNKIRADIEEGRTLRDAVAKHKKIFSPLWVSMIETGEASGQLAPAFEHIASYLDRAVAINRKVKSAMVYPSILIVVCIAAILIFTLKIIPMFGDIYRGFDMELPILTLGVLIFSRFMQRFILIIVIMLAAIIFLGGLYIKTQQGRIMFDTFKLKMPVFGSLTQAVIIERFVHGLGTLIKSGMPILSGLDIVGELCGNRIYEAAIESIKEDVRAGKSMASRLEMFDLFPPLVTQMISVGEETGKLSDMLDRLAVFYRTKIDTTVDRLTAAIEPLILIFMGSTIGVLVVAMYLPIFKIATGGTK